MKESFRKTAFIFLVGLLATALGITGYEIAWDEDHAPTAIDAEFEPITFATINARPARDCEVTYLIEDEVLLTYPLKLAAAQTGAPCNCAGAVPIPYNLSVKITVPDGPYTEEELLSMVEPPYKEYLIGKWSDPKIRILPNKRPCPELPQKDKPGRLEPAPR